MPFEGKIVKLMLGIKKAVGNTANPSTKNEPTGILKFLFDKDNFTGAVNYDRGNSKNGEVEVNYIPRGTKSTVVTTQTNNFVTTNTPSMEKVNVAISATLFQPFSVGLQYIEQIEMNNMQMISALVESELEGLRQKIEEFYATQLAALFGVNRVTGTNAVRVANILKTSDGTMNATGITSFKAEMRRNLMNTYAIIGDGNMNKFVDLVGLNTPIVAGQPSNQIANQIPFRPFTSFELEAALGVNHCAVVEMGAVQPIVVNRYSAKELQGMLGTATMMETIADPKIPGLVYDIKIKLNDGFPENFFVEIGARFGTFVIPANAYKVGDPMLGNNGLLRYQFLTA